MEERKLSSKLVLTVNIMTVLYEMEAYFLLRKVEKIG